jgi:hypothetical protein
MGLTFGIFDHIEPVPGLTLTQIYRERLQLRERYDAAGFYAYHLADDLFVEDIMPHHR